MSVIPVSSPSRTFRSVSTMASLCQQGTVVLFGVPGLCAVGFLPMSAAHNAARDTRHSFVFH